MIYISHLLSDMEMKEVIEQTGAGLESIEFSIAENLDSLSEKLRAYKIRLDNMGKPELTMHGPFLDINPVAYDREIRKVTMLRYSQSYEAARELGAKKIVYHTCLNPDVYLLTGWADRMVDFMQEFLSDRQDMEVVMENVYDLEWNPILETAKKLPYDNFKLCLDIGHAYRFSPIPVSEWAKNLEKYLSHIHVHDNLKDWDNHLALGNGSIPLEEVFACLRKRENITYTIECNTKEDVLLSYQRLQKLLSGEGMHV
jgi:sugar phosphate isomerase/epimerase